MDAGFSTSHITVDDPQPVSPADLTKWVLAQGKESADNMVARILKNGEQNGVMRELEIGQKLVAGKYKSRDIAIHRASALQSCLVFIFGHEAEKPCKKMLGRSDRSTFSEVCHV